MVAGQARAVRSSQKLSRESDFHYHAGLLSQKENWFLLEEVGLFLRIFLRAMVWPWRASVGPWTGLVWC